MSLTPICVPCGLTMRCVENDFLVKDPDCGPGAPASVWMGDKFHCDGCGNEIVTGFGRSRPAPSAPRDAERALEFRYA